MLLFLQLCPDLTFLSLHASSGFHVSACDSRYQLNDNDSQIYIFNLEISPKCGGVQPAACGLHVAQDGCECGLKLYEVFFVIMCHNVFNVWPRTTPLLPVWPRDAKRLDSPGSWDLCFQHVNSRSLMDIPGLACFHIVSFSWNDTTTLPADWARNRPSPFIHLFFSPFTSNHLQSSSYCFSTSAE